MSFINIRNITFKNFYNFSIINIWIKSFYGDCIRNTLNIDYIDNMLFMIEKIKDLTKLGRDKIIIVDNLSFKL